MIASAVREILATAGRGTKETDLFVGRMPAAPVGATCVYVAPNGSPVIRGLCPTPIASNVGGQVQIRRATYEEAEEEAERVFNVLAIQIGVQPSGYAFIHELTPSAPFMLKRDQGEHPVFAVNFTAIRDPEVV